ncbi:MAG: S-adenosylmethionine decarboxylase [Syntrophaceae bacterium]|nr:S-adenosylmethionine decarboxylase [Syntrophaceae bacterium]
MAGVEWLLEMYGCPAETLRSRETLTQLFQDIITRMNLKPLGECIWHEFPSTRGMTGFWLLQESHLAIHTFPEFHSACLNVFSCSERSAIDWEAVLSGTLGAKEVRAREFLRVYEK